MTRRLAFLALAGSLPFGAALADEVGSFTNDWTGNGIVVEAIADPKVAGVTCHIAHFERGFLDKLSKGNWFEDPSNASIACRQTGPIVIGDIERGEGGEEVFSERKSSDFQVARGAAYLRREERHPDLCRLFAPGEGSERQDGDQHRGAARRRRDLARLSRRVARRRQGVGVAR